ncbi:MAG: putative glycoside hydrolase [Treponemataceae bacterium]
MKITMRKTVSAFILVLFIINFSFAQDRPILAGFEKGLYKLEKIISTKDKNANASYQKKLIWNEGSVKKIIYTPIGWFFLTTEGIVHSNDLIEFDKRNDGLPYNTIKQYNGTEKKFVTIPKELKDLAIHPENPQIMVTATKDSVYLSRNGGLKWISIGLNAKTTGVKSLCVLDVPIYDKSGEEKSSKLVVFLSHSIYGFSSYEPDSDLPQWVDLPEGFLNIPGNTGVEEIACMLPVKITDKNKNYFYELYLGTSYIPRLYKFNWSLNCVDPIWQGGIKNSTQDSLVYLDGNIVYLGLDGFKAVEIATGKKIDLPAKVRDWEKIINDADKDILSLFIPGEKIKKNFHTDVSLTELWLTKRESAKNKYADRIENKRGMYVPANQAADYRLDEHIKTLKANNLNAVVVDMKDDAGLLRFDARTPLLLKYGSQSSYSVKLDEFVPKMKKQGIYLIARIVVFKDKNLYNKNSKKFAVWDVKTNSSWRGIKGTINILDEQGNATGKKETEYYDEFWVDPYCENVWEYNVLIAKELIERGFDEIQFDYIRFPTDGYNLYDAKFRFQEKGMDKESALISFLSYAKKNIDAPIGIDIYGANGWYRSSARTGQDVEMMSKYVDVVCPMFYPNHFEQDFLTYSPEIERPYRIYNLGTYRNYIMGRGKILIRPWVQAFFMKVSYDIKYYNKDYVLREIYGVKDSLNQGYLYWNNAGRYTDIVPDVGNSDYIYKKNLEAEQNE